MAVDLSGVGATGWLRSVVGAGAGIGVPSDRGEALVEGRHTIIRCYLQYPKILARQ